jgi:anti-sigma factor RsiW
MLSCQELVQFLDEYWSGSLPEETVAKFEEHLAACPSCINYANTYREAVHVGRKALDAFAHAAPENVPETLVSAILALRARPEGRS